VKFPIQKLIFLAGGLFVLWNLTRDVARGHIEAKYPPEGISRAGQPALFWFMIVVGYAFVIALLAFMLTRAW
jgi:hypothetical protein